MVLEVCSSGDLRKNEIHYMTSNVARMYISLRSPQLNVWVGETDELKRASSSTVTLVFPTALTQPVYPLRGPFLTVTT